MFKITTHTLVKNEDKWIWYALQAWLPYATKMLIVDDTSVDRTVELIKMIKDSKIDFQKANLQAPKDHTEMRNLMIDKTETLWFLILDGDEIWNQSTIKKFLHFLENCDKNIYGVVMQTRNCIGDVYHYLPEGAGKYHFLGRTGNLTIRAYRKLPGFRWQGDYPLEAYSDNKNNPINGQDNHLKYYDGYYWHMTYLVRSSNSEKVKGQRKTKYELGIKVNNEDLPEVFNLPRPKNVPSPWLKMSPAQYLLSTVATPFKRIKRKLA